MSWYSKYTGRSVGRILHFIYEYCGLQYAEVVQVGNGVVTYYGAPFATYTWDGDTDIPTFDFALPYLYFNEVQNRKKEEIKIGLGVA